MNKKYENNIVSYRDKIKGADSFTYILERLCIVRDVFSGMPKMDVAQKYGTHRNTVGNIMRLFNRQAKPEDLQGVELGYSLEREEVLQNYSFLKPRSRAPSSHSKMATKEQEDLVARFHEDLGFGYGRLLTHIQRTLDGADGRIGAIKEIKILENLSEAQIKGIYKRRTLRAKTRKAGSKQRVRLYDYERLAAFEHLHYDTKTITDLKALPLDIYNKFKNNPELPVIEWNIIDAASRFRFMAYSHGRTSEFGFHFLVCVLQFIRGTLAPMRDLPIRIGMDNGSEFCLGSETKLQTWNQSLALLNAKVWAYNPNWDVRKNLIERSHRTDDEEFFVPKGPMIRDKQSFLDEAKRYFLYFNATRSHTGIGMNKRTPIEKLRSNGIHNAERLLQFPIMILEDSIGTIKKNTEIVQAVSSMKLKLDKGEKLDQKKITDIGTTFANFFSQPHAQNVLTYYLYFAYFYVLS